MVIIEACSHGIFAISSACAGPLEIIRPGENGWIFPIADVDRLVQYLQQIIDDPAILPAQEVITASVDRFSAKTVAGLALQAIEAAILR